MRRLESCLGLRRDVLSRGLRHGDRPLPVVRCERRTDRERESLAIGMVKNGFSVFFTLGLSNRT